MLKMAGHDASLGTLNLEFWARCGVGMFVPIWILDIRGYGLTLFQNHWRLDHAAWDRRRRLEGFCGWKMKTNDFGILELGV
jgi:hypothetical protein